MLLHRKEVDQRPALTWNSAADRNAEAAAQLLAVNIFMSNRHRSWADSAGWIGAARSALRW